VTRQAVARFLKLEPASFHPLEAFLDQQLAGKRPGRSLALPFSVLSALGLEVQLDRGPKRLTPQGFTPFATASLTPAD